MLWLGVLLVAVTFILLVLANKEISISGCTAQPFYFQHLSANYLFLLSHVSYSRVGENFLTDQPTPRNSC